MAWRERAMHAWCFPFCRGRPGVFLREYARERECTVYWSPIAQVLFIVLPLRVSEAGACHAARVLAARSPPDKHQSTKTATGRYRFTKITSRGTRWRSCASLQRRCFGKLGDRLWVRELSASLQPLSVTEDSVAARAPNSGENPRARLLEK